MVRNCTCKNAYQDKRYGRNRRVMNEYRKSSGGYRCTVCTKEHSGVPTKR